MGRTRKVVAISTGKIGKEKRLNRKIQEQSVKIDREQLETEVPKWLSREAAEEYRRVVAEAAKINLLDNLDMSTLAIYANAYAMYVEASTRMSTDGMTIMGPRGAEIPSPYMAIADKCASQIFRCSTKLGLATTDRLKLIVPTQSEEREENKFLKFLKA
jgi:P27 family predicted phage terminase small subunit